MKRTGNTIGSEGRRQHNEDDPQNGDRHHMQERLADKEIQEGLEEIAEARTEAEESTESLETSPQADGVPEDENVGSPEGEKPATEERLEDAEAEEDPER
jgi:hypothetical protein